jgi:hypothetical protein
MKCANATSVRLTIEQTFHRYHQLEGPNPDWVLADVQLDAQ